jgi:hypothetical protein
VPVRDTCRVGDETGHDVLAKNLTGQLAAEILTGPRAMLLVDEVDAFEEEREPIQACLG